MTYTKEELMKMKTTELRILARGLDMPGAWKAIKSDMASYIFENQIEEITELPLESNEVVHEVILESQAPSLISNPEKKKGAPKSVVMLHNGVANATFERTYDCSDYISKEYNISYSAADKFVVGHLKRREVKFPKNADSVLGEYSFMYQKDFKY